MKKLYNVIYLLLYVLNWSLLLPQMEEKEVKVIQSIKDKQEEPLNTN